jgi:DNA-directed RNA polymerase specialized sigma24 family protein
VLPYGPLSELDVTQSAKQFDESLINYYNEHFCSRADAVYRFAFALTLSLDGAKQLVDQTFQEIAASLESIHGAGSPQFMTLLITTCYEAFVAQKNKGFKEGKSAITKVLKPLTVEERAALTAVDACGLAPSDAAKALKWSDLEFRRTLAKARRGLMMSSLEH